MFFYLLLSWICSAVNEVVEAWLRNRANDLETGIRRLLHDPDPHGGGFWLNTGRKIARLFQWKKASSSVSKTGGLASKVYDHALISCLYPHPNDLPSYIPSRNFALALMDVMAPGRSGAAGATTPPGLQAPVTLQPLREAVAAPGNVSNEEVRTAVLALMDASGNDPARFRENLESWFNSSMDSVSGWYKRRTQVLILALGFAIAVAVNGDSILTMQMLWNNSDLRSSMAAQAVQAAGQANDATARQRAAQIQVSGLPIGWNGQDELHRPPWVLGTWSAMLGWSWHLFAVHWLGWLITGFAISLGAPFWFDLLNKFVVVRSAVKPQERSSEESSKP